MERRERVNSEPEMVAGARSREVPQPPAPMVPAIRTAAARIFRPSPRHACLYIGPSGERCSRPADRGDFCSKHAIPEAGATPEAVLVKRLIAVAGVVAVLWPIIVDLVREILRLLR